jgi:pSer/pThr/pTyr-binding forkhead associated (FHA) protein
MARLLIHHLSGSKAGTDEIIPLPRYVTDLKIGREVGCEIRFDPFNDSAVSRHHAAIRWEKDDAPGSEAANFVLIDLISSNGTFLNGHRLERPELLKSGDVIEFGRSGPAIRVQIEIGGVVQMATPSTGFIEKVVPPAETLLKTPVPRGKKVPSAD